MPKYPRGNGRGQRLCGVVEQVAARLDRGDVLVPGLRVHRDHEVDAAARAQMTGAGDAHLVPGRQALNIGGEDVARCDGHAHAHDRAREKFVRACRTGSVHIRETDDEIIHAFDRHAGPAFVISIRYFFMSHAPVGQRSAHRLQCRQRSSSFDHDAPGLEIVRDIEILREVVCRRRQALTQIRLLAVLREGDAIHRADVDAGVAFDAERRGEHRLHVAVQAALRFLEGERIVVPELDLCADVPQRHHFISHWHAIAPVGRNVVVVAPLVDAHLLADDLDRGQSADARYLHRCKACRLKPLPHGRAPPPR